MDDRFDVVFRHLPRSRELEARIRARVEKLRRLCPRLAGGRVVIHAPHHHHRKGNRFEVRIRLRVPGTELPGVAAGDRVGHERLEAALRDAFEAAEHVLRSHREKRHLRREPSGPGPDRPGPARRRRVIHGRSRP